LSISLFIYHVISYIELFRPSFNKVGAGAGRVKYVFLGLWQQLRCQAEGKKCLSAIQHIIQHPHSYPTIVVLIPSRIFAFGLSGVSNADAEGLGTTISPNPTHHSLLNFSSK
jgi:hypothetical protein